MVRMHFVMTAFRQWSTDNKFPDLVVYASFHRYRMLMASIEEAFCGVGGRGDFEDQSRFMEAGGRPYLDMYTKRDCTLKWNFTMEMGLRRRVLIRTRMRSLVGREDYPRQVGLARGDQAELRATRRVLRPGTHMSEKSATR